ncbi:MAG: hypothetical protein HUU22_15615 [Phycisphaerae bacterium]|nr:hypothetical protein [Phycisphaerae bacterium]NUQ47452.1 hypothetical protein [Phycisphaerae bacterium]
MDGLELLQQAQAAGLTVRAEGDRIRVRGPKQAEPLACLLIQNKDAVLRALARQSGSFHYTDEVMELGDVCAGWTPTRWAAELRRKADCCDRYRPDIAAYYRKWAEDIEARLRGANP